MKETGIHRLDTLTPRVGGVRGLDWGLTWMMGQNYSQKWSICFAKKLIYYRSYLFLFHMGVSVCFHTLVSICCCSLSSQVESLLLLVFCDFPVIKTQVGCRIIHFYNWNFRLFPLVPYILCVGMIYRPIPFC